MRRRSTSIFLIMILIIAVIGGSYAYNVYGAKLFGGSANKEAETISELLNGEEVAYGDGNIIDNSSLYEDDNGVITMYLTICMGNASEGTNHTWTEVNEHSAYYYDDKGIDRYKADAILQIGTEKGVDTDDFGYGKSAPNATVQIRGQSSSINAQKNYKIEIKKNQGSWNGQTTIDLNKHMTDGLRYRNKLGFDLLSDIGELMSLRTTFVHLYVKDLTAEHEEDELTDGENAEGEEGIVKKNTSKDGFVDYGLYTQVEQLNKKALRTHGLDRTGHLYKINYFEFRMEDALKLETDKDYDVKKFEEYLEIKGASDHSKLLDMIKDLNDYTVSIDEILEKHFNIDNLAYWMAFNILTGNVDTQSRNSYLYSAQNTDTWYLYSWDLDGIFRKDEIDIQNFPDYVGWEYGVSNYWNNVLFKRCLKSDYFRKYLDMAIEDIKRNLNKEKLTGMISDYRKVTDAYAFTEPDIIYEPLTKEEYDIVSDSLPNLVDFYYEKYKESLEKPMPFFIGTPTISDSKMNFYWDESYDLDQDDINYNLQLAKDPEITDIVYEYKGFWNTTSCDIPPAGEYFLKITATDENGNTQEAFDYYDYEESRYPSVICFYLYENGETARNIPE